MNAVVRDVMTRNVITVGPDTPFEVIAAALREHRVSAFAVRDRLDYPAAADQRMRAADDDRQHADQGWL